MNFYLVDYENTKALTGVSVLSENDTVVIFYSNKSNSLSFDAHMDIIASKAIFEYKSINTGGQNALDFQLSTYLGYILGKNEEPDSKIYIVSKDKGFSYITSFWKKERDINIQRIDDLTSTPSKDAEECDNYDIESMLRSTSLELTDGEISKIIDIICKYKTKIAMNSNINKLLKDSTKTGQVLKLLEKFINK